MNSNESLPSTLKFQVPSSIPQARSYTFEQRSNESSYPVQTGQKIQIDIPRLQRSYLQKSSSLRLTLEVEMSSSFDPETNSVCLDTAGGYSLIDNIEVYDYLGSTLLERIEGVGQLVAALLDTPHGRIRYGNNASMGTTSLRPLRGPENFEFTTNYFEQSLFIEGPISGSVLSNISSSSKKYNIELELPLLSFLGELSGKLAPLHNGYTIIIALNAMENALGVTKIDDLSTNITSRLLDANVTDISMMCDILELGPTAESLVLSSIGEGPLVMHTKSYRHYAREESGGSGIELNYNWPINLNASSVSSILWFMRPQITGFNARYRSLSHKIKNNLLSWKFIYGSSSLPDSAGIRCSANDKNAFYASSGTEAYNSLMKSRRVTDSDGITKTNFNLNAFDTTTTIGTTPFLVAPSLYSLTPCDVAQLGPGVSEVTGALVPPVGRFSCGLSTELVTGNVISGLNTNGMSTAIQARFVPPASSIFITPTTDVEKIAIQLQQGTRDIVPFVADIYMEYDAFISILPNISTNVSF
jgi:hypothetical protein